MLKKTVSILQDSNTAPKHLQKNQGGALLTALFIMTLVAIVATAISMRLQLDIYRTQLVINQDKLYLASNAVTFWAVSLLNNQDLHFDSLLKQGSVANYPSNMQDLQKDVKVSGGLYDLQAYFNLNNLIDKKALLTFVNLIKVAIPHMNPSERTKLTLAVMDWIRDYDLARGKDLYSSYYLAQNPAYYPSHQLMQSKSELRLVKDITKNYYAALLPWITVLPKTSPININTAPKEVLMSLLGSTSVQKINALLEARASKPITKLNQIKELSEKIDLPLEQITTESDYFLCMALVSNQEHQLAVYTVLERKREKNKKFSVSILRMSFNEF